MTDPDVPRSDWLRLALMSEADEDYAGEWGEILDEQNFEALDAEVMLSGPREDRPSPDDTDDPDPHHGAKYHATDVNVVFAWDEEADDGEGDWRVLNSGTDEDPVPDETHVEELRGERVCVEDTFETSDYDDVSRATRVGVRASRWGTAAVWQARHDGGSDSDFSGDIHHHFYDSEGNHVGRWGMHVHGWENPHYKIYTASATPPEDPNPNTRLTLGAGREEVHADWSRIRRMNLKSYANSLSLNLENPADEDARIRFQDLEDTWFSLRVRAYDEDHSDGPGFDRFELKHHPLDFEPLTVSDSGRVSIDSGPTGRTRIESAGELVLRATPGGAEFYEDVDHRGHTSENVVWEADDSRPSDPETGQRFFDTDLGQPIWYDGERWVDAQGESLTE